MNMKPAAVLSVLFVLVGYNVSEADEPSPLETSVAQPVADEGTSPRIADIAEEREQSGNIQRPGDVAASAGLLTGINARARIKAQQEFDERKEIAAQEAERQRQDQIGDDLSAMYGIDPNSAAGRLLDQPDMRDITIRALGDLSQQGPAPKKTDRETADQVTSKEGATAPISTNQNPTLNIPQQPEGIPRYGNDQATGPVINGVHHGIPAGPPQKTCHGAILNGQCTGPEF